MPENAALSPYIAGSNLLRPLLIAFILPKIAVDALDTWGYTDILVGKCPTLSKDGWRWTLVSEILHNF